MKLDKRDLAASYKRFYSSRSGSGSSPYRRSDYEYYVDEDNDEDNGEIFEFDGVTSRKDKLGRSRGRGKDYGISSRKDYGSRRDYNYKDYIKDDPYYLRDNGGYYGYGRDGVDRSGYGYDDGGGGGAKDRADHYGGHSGYGHGHKKECCPLVIKPLVFLALLGSIAAATAFFNILITMNLGRKRRRRRRSYDDGNSGSGSIGPGFADVLHAGTCHMINRNRKSPSTSAVHLPPLCLLNGPSKRRKKKKGDAASEISKGKIFRLR